MSFYRRFGKRSFDLAASALAVIVLSPLLAGVALAVRLKLGSPVLFRQERTGLGGRAFHVLKFRSMLDARDADGALLSDEARLTPFGSWLRASSLDELPALLNILRGEMSVVGPRPHVHRYLERYDAVQIRRFETRPGLTGWTAVNGRNALTWEQKFAFDVWYVDRISFTLDCRIIWMTLGKVLRREGISADQHTTMPEFMGSRGES